MKKNDLTLFAGQELPQEKLYRSYIPAVFISAALPLRDIKNAKFVRKYNNITMTLSGAEKVPYGKYGRLLLSVFTTHAVQEKNTGNEEIVIRYNSLQELLDEMQIPRQRGKDIMEQLGWFRGCSFLYEEVKEMKIKAQANELFEDLIPDNQGTVRAKKISTGLIPFFETMQYVQITDSVDTQRNVAFEIKLSKPFVNLSQEHSVPINYTVYKEISAPLGKDLYAWFCYRNNSLGKDPLFVPRHTLVEQFMPVNNTNNPQAQESVNYRNIKEQIEQIKTKYYPGLNVKILDDGSGIELRKSPPVILPDDKKRYVLVSDDK